MTSPLFKVLTEAEWAAFEATETFAGTPLDREHGFIHLCAGDQVAGVVARYFAQRTGLLVAAVEVPRDHRLKWETVADGCYPHFFGPLEHDWVLSADPIPDDPDQRALALALIAV